MSITSKTSRNFQWQNQGTPSKVGPGAYNPSYKHSMYHAKIPFGSTTRRELFGFPDDKPGPGEYDSLSDFSYPQRARSSIGLSSDRKYFVDNLQNPGPGEYNTVKGWNEPSPFVIKQTKPSPQRARSVQKKPDVIPPGPGQYDPKLSKLPSCVPFSKSRAPQRSPVIDDGIPGPADYNLDSQNSPNKGKPSRSFKSNDVRNPFPSQGVDGYMLEHTAWAAAPITKGPFGGNSVRELQFFSSDDTPGPGTYATKNTIENDITSKMGAKRSDFGIDRKTYGKEESGPGPGFYEDSTSTLSTKGIAIPHASRGPLFKVQRNPSPSQYDTETRDAIIMAHKKRQNNPAFVDKSDQHSVFSNKEASQKPGPAAYNAQMPKKDNQMQFTKDMRFKPKTFAGERLNDAPDPSSYGRAAPLVTINGGYIGKGERFGKIKNGGPPPGQYQNPEKCNLIKESFNIGFDPKKQRSSKYKDCLGYESHYVDPDSSLRVDGI